ncbi:MAG: hypothetical protein AB7F22_18230 [Reyranella sp.]|uniref:hypothetical protein n=1 Tax=Reyranella sp. TaxID=1929291 RepID=UPI003D12D1EA
MATDVVLSSELKSLQDELAATRRERTAAVVPPSAAPVAPAEPAAESAEDRELRDQLTQLIDEAGSFIEEAERTIAANPVRSVLGALVVGIVIGRLLGRR